MTMRELLARLHLGSPDAERQVIDEAELDRRITGLSDAATAAAGRLPDDVVARATAVVERARERRQLSDQLTVVALAGSTGAGKSTLFNSIVGDDVAGVGVLRPTTSEPQAALWELSTAADELLAWLQVSRRHQVPGPDVDLTDLILLDLPDHDSTHAHHRAQVDRLVARVDLMIWVVDPQKYADALVHDAYLSKFAHHADVTVVVLNQVDRLTVAEADACLRDLRRLVDADGLPTATVLATSMLSGQGTEQLAAVIADALSSRRATLSRLSADVATAADELELSAADPQGRVSAAPPADVAALTDALTEAAGASVIGTAVAESRNRAAAGAVGWPVLRWLHRLRPDPVARLRLDRPGVDPTIVRTSIPAMDPAAGARARSAVVQYADSAAQGAPAAWLAAARQVADEACATLPDRLDQAVARAPLVNPRRPRWWAAVGALQWLLLAVAVLGGGWLLGLAVLGYLQFDAPTAPKVEGIPVPTLALVVGLLGGIVVGVVSRAIARVGARRAATAARAALRSEVASVAAESVVAPVGRELATLMDFRAGLAAARQSPRSRGGSAHATTS